MISPHRTSVWCAPPEFEHLVRRAWRSLKTQQHAHVSRKRGVRPGSMAGPFLVSFGAGVVSVD